MIPQTIKRYAILPLPLLMLGLAGCPFSPNKKKDPDPPPPPPVYLPQTSITNVLENLKRAYIDMNYDEYEKLLDEAYGFVFDPDDVGPETGNRDVWPRSDDLESARNMFGRQPNTRGQVVDEIRLKFTPGTPEVSPQNPAWRLSILRAVELELRTTNQSGDTNFLKTPVGYEAYLHFIQTEEMDPELNLPIWKIVLWEDKPPPGKAGLIAARE